MGRRRGNTGMTNINPYKDNLFSSLGQFTGYDAKTIHCAYKNQYGLCANQKAKFFKQKCKLKHSCVSWSEWENEDNPKVYNLDSIYVKEKDYFHIILEKYFYDKEALNCEQFRQELADALFRETDREQCKTAFFDALEQLSNMPLQELPIIPCLMLETVKLNDYNTYLQSINGKDFYLSFSTHSTYSKMNSILRKIAFYCYRKNTQILHYVSHFSVRGYDLERLKDSIKLSFQTMMNRNSWLSDELLSDKHQKIRLMFRNDMFIYTMDKITLPGKVYANDNDHSYAKVNCLIALPIFNIFSDIGDEDFLLEIAENPWLEKDIKSLYWDDINRMLCHKHVLHNLYGMGQIRWYDSSNKVHIDFLDFPYQIIKYTYPECFDNQELIFIHKSQYELMKIEIESYYHKKLVGKTVKYTVETYSLKAHEYKTYILAGYIQHFQMYQIKVYFNYNELDIKFKYFEYPVRDKALEIEY